MNNNQEETTQTADILPKGGLGATAGSLKIVMAVIGIADFVIGIVSNKKDRQVEQEDTPGSENAPEPKSSNVLEWISLGLTLTDFSISYGIGYHIYSPMDTTSDEAYNKKCAVPQSACSVYTYLWWAKTATSSLSSLAGTLGEKMFHSSTEYVKKGIDIIYLAECFVSGFAELFAFIEASAVTASVDGEYKKDGGCFISDSLGFAFDDIKSILDFCIGQTKSASTPLIVSREIFCALYIVSQISTGAVILANK